MNCYRIHQKSLNFIYPFKFYSNFTNKNASWLHFSWPTQYVYHTIVLVLAYPTFVEIDLNEVQDT